MPHKTYVCADFTCRHLVVAEELPRPMKWDDGHICYFINEKALTKKERNGRVEGKAKDG